MTSMASAKNFTLYHPLDLSKVGLQNEVRVIRGVRVSNHGFHSKKNGIILRKSFSVKANGHSVHSTVDMVNGKKVNGREVGGGGGQSLGTRTSSGILKVNKVDEPIHSFLLGSFVEGSFVYRQTFSIRSYEIGPDKTATMETLMNLLQETALNHVTSSGVSGNGFGTTREMSLRKLIWVVTRIHIQVEKYRSWGDVVDIDTWVDAAGKNGMRRDWIIRDSNTKRIITRATSTWVIMNRETRRLSKIPEEVKEEVQPFYLDRLAIATADADNEKIEKLTDETAERIRSGLAPRWSDMDANQHVNNVKYIGWILESVPINVLEDYNLTSMTLEYRRECRQSNLLESLTSIENGVPVPPNEISNVVSRTELESTHLLRMQGDKAEIIRARSIWQPKHKHII